MLIYCANTSCFFAIWALLFLISSLSKNARFLILVSIALWHSSLGFGIIEEYNLFLSEGKAEAYFVCPHHYLWVCVLRKNSCNNSLLLWRPMITSVLRVSVCNLTSPLETINTLWSEPSNGLFFYFIARFRFDVVVSIDHCSSQNVFSFHIIGFEASSARTNTHIADF